jgi:hypothetical protein
MFWAFFDITTLEAAEIIWLKMDGSNYPVMECHIPEELNPQH